MEMEQGHRHQRKLDHQAGRDHRQQCARDPDRDPFLAALKKAARPGGRMQGDDRGDRGEAHLEARAGQGFGPKQQHDERARGDEADADGIAAERNSRQDQHRGHATSDRRHLRPGEQGITDPRRRRGRRRDEHQVEPQRQAFAQRQQPQRQEHCEADRGGDVEAADRQQMGKAAAPHGVRVIFADRILIPRR